MAAFGGHSVFNGASPSSDSTCVARIVADYVTPVGNTARILDVGGTASGFKRRAQLPAGTELIVANPQPGSGADCKYVADIPVSGPGFDLAMLFGVMMFLSSDDLLALMRDVRQRLRGNATFLVAEPDPEGVWGQIEVIAKKALMAVSRAWDPKNFIFYTQRQAKDLLFAANFGLLRERSDLVPRFALPPYYVIAASV
jgi:hypothetical protein